MDLFDYEKKHLQMLRTSLAECTVLLKQSGDFPLPYPCRIAAYGGGVRRTIKGGTGSGEVNSRFFINVEQGLENAGFIITTKKWLDDYDRIYTQARKEFPKVIRAEAKAKGMNSILYGLGKVMPEPEYDLPLDSDGDAEAAIYVLARISGEGSDREPISGDIKLTATEKRDILALNKKYEKFMLVLNAGGAVDLSELSEVRNILVLSQLGVETGNALADILLGKANPSGKLTTTWSAWEDYFPMEDFGDNNDTRYREGIYVGYRYFDSVGKKALYPFGFGLSYTTFSIHLQTLEAVSDTVILRANVTNTGKVPGKEVVQVYVSAPDGKLDKPYQDLAGFVKTGELAPGAAETVEVRFSLKDLASYDEEASAYILEKGLYIVRVGNSSVDTTVAGALLLEETFIVTKVRKTCGITDFNDWKPEKKPLIQLDDAVPVITVDTRNWETEIIHYDKEYEVETGLKDLTDEQLAYINVGEFSSSFSIIGEASTKVAGAAGETTSKLADKGIPGMVMADGPAGLRLSPQFYRDAKGAHTVGKGGIPESVAELLPKPLLWMISITSGKSKPPKNVTPESQYATAIPIGTALAQSWNLEFARVCGDIVGAEMERFGVHLWLAPALNIHRSIRCGRNFEYYSEDPLISGKFAAAVTMGVQSHHGCGTTLKHYAANNQESNRYGNNSIVSERAMREIYLKGFGICVKESQPKAVMTSYNLLNGTHTAERRDLCEDILRCEFGFNGIIMTDWVISNGMMNNPNDIHPKVKPQLVAAAGGDLFMPGSKADYKSILAGLEEGSLTRGQLLINATRVYRMAMEMTGKKPEVSYISLSGTAQKD